MLRTLTRVLGRRDRREAGDQLALPLDAAPAPRTAEELLARLKALGLADIDRCRLTRNRTVMVSFRGRELRVHAGYLTAPEPVLRAVVKFVRGRTRAERRQAQVVILAHPVERPSRARRPERTRPEDEPACRALTDWHARYNAEHFGGALRSVPVRISRRMKTRLGHYSAATPAGDVAEIVIAARHIRRHGWDEALHTLLHEMVHQWQDEHGHAIDHGRSFRQKAREVGITPSARRLVTPKKARAERGQTLGTRAAREE
ncbi:MAG: SprT-like domain-containing protein [Gemmatimonadaceae bacterium]